MADHSVLADVGKTIVELLRAGAVPEPVAKAEQIGLCGPGDRGSFVVGLHPYDVREYAHARRMEPVVLPDGRRQDPPGSYILYYMLSVVSKSEVATRTLDEQRILGKVLQLLRDNALLPERHMPVRLRDAGEPMALELTQMELEEKVKVWTMFNEPWRPCVFFSVSPVLIDSAVIRDGAPRVLESALSSGRRERSQR